MKNVLVTGGAGFIGSNFVRTLLQAEPVVQITNLDLLTYAGSLENLSDLPDPSRHHFIQGDICDQALVRRLFAQNEIDTVVHFAAESHVDRSITGPAAFVRTNVVGTFELLEAARWYWQGTRGQPQNEVRFHHVSTDEVFGSLEPGAPAFTEVSPYDPHSPYSATKAASDQLVRSYFHTYGLPVSITNGSNTYGPYQFPEKLVPVIILNAIQGQPLPVYGDGQQVRDWLYVDDHCEAIYRVLKASLPGETYNVGGGNQTTNLEIIWQICALLSERLPGSIYLPFSQLIRFMNDRPGHDRRYQLDIAKMGQLGWEPREALAAGLARTVDWYLSHLDWASAITHQPSYQEWIDSNYGARGVVD